MSIPPVSQGLDPSAANSVKPSGIPNFGSHRVKNITSGVMGIWDKIKNSAEAINDREQGYYAIAAICVLIAVILLLVIGLTGGVAGLGMIAGGAVTAPFISVAAASVLRSRQLGNERKEWQMPPFSSDIKGKPEAEAEWKRLWDARNQAKVAYNNVMDTVKKQEALRDVTREEEYAKNLLKAYEAAEVNFWQFADEEVAYEHIEKFNEARTKRGESEKL